MGSGKPEYLENTSDHFANNVESSTNPYVRETLLSTKVAIGTDYIGRC